MIQEAFTGRVIQKTLLIKKLAFHQVLFPIQTLLDICLEEKVVIQTDIIAKGITTALRGSIYSIQIIQEFSGEMLYAINL